MSIIFLSRPVTLAASVMAGVGCSALWPEQPQLVAQIDIAPQVRTGEPVVITLRVTNRSDDTATLYSASAESALAAFNPIVRDANGTAVWSRYTGPSLLLGMVTRIRPGETIEYRVTWDQKISAGVRVPAGKYQVSNSPELWERDDRSLREEKLRVASRSLKIVP